MYVGIGFGLTYLPSIVIVGFYFDKRRALATGLAVCGSGIGTFIFAPLSAFLLDTYGWQGANWIISAIILHGVFLGALYRPLETVVSRAPPRPESPPPASSPPHGAIIQKILEEKRRQRTISTGSMDGMLITRDNRFVRDAEAACKAVLRRKRLVSTNGSPGADELPPPPPPTGVESDVGVGAVNRRLLELKTVSRTASLRSTGSAGDGEPDGEAASGEDREGYATSCLSVPDGGGPPRRRRRQPARPLYRQDIFYSGSVTNIAEFKSTASMTSYVQSYTSIPASTRLGSSEGWKRTVSARCQPIFYVLRQMFDFSLMRSFTFLLLCTSGVLAMSGE